MAANIPFAWPQSPRTREARGMLGRARNSSDGDGARYNMIYCTVHTDNEDPALLNQAMGDATVGRHRYRRGRARTRAHTYAGADRASITHPGGTAGQTTHTASERSSKAPMLHGNNEGPEDRGSAPRSRGPTNPAGSGMQANDIERASERLQTEKKKEWAWRTPKTVRPCPQSEAPREAFPRRHSHV